MPTVLFVTNPYMEPLLEGVMDVARERRWLLVSGMRRTGRLPRNVKPDGVVGTLSDPRTVAQVDAVQGTDRLPDQRREAPDVHELVAQRIA